MFLSKLLQFIYSLVKQHCVRIEFDLQMGCGIGYEVFGEEILDQL